MEDGVTRRKRSSSLTLQVRPAHFRHPAKFLEVRDANVLAGYLQYEACDDEGDSVVYVIELQVSEAYQGNGVGSFLMDYAEDLQPGNATITRLTVQNSERAPYLRQTTRERLHFTHRVVIIQQLTCNKGRRSRFSTSRRLGLVKHVFRREVMGPKVRVDCLASLLELCKVFTKQVSQHFFVFTVD